MCYCNQIKYRLLTTTKIDFPTMGDQLFDQLPTDETIVRLVFSKCRLITNSTLNGVLF